ncbi:MAG: hypothetical protein JNJ88_09385 [Planctomycetes bacterium]|nr:hypothetical protein [Planctomycetota bacterium]
MNRTSQPAADQSTLSGFVGTSAAPVRGAVAEDLRARRGDIREALDRVRRRNRWAAAGLLACSAAAALGVVVLWIVRQRDGEDSGWPTLRNPIVWERRTDSNDKNASGGGIDGGSPGRSAADSAAPAAR